MRPMNTDERSVPNASGSAGRTPRNNILALVTAVGTSHRTREPGRRPGAARIIGRKSGWWLRAQAERAPDPLHVHAEHPRALAASEGGDREARKVAHRRVRAVAERRGDLLAERVEVDLLGAPLRE